MKMVNSIHEKAQKKNDGSWTINDGPLHDMPSERMFLALKELHDRYCLHIDINFSPLLKAKLNDYFFARNEYGLPPAPNNTVNSFSFDVIVRDGAYVVGNEASPVLELNKGYTYHFFMTKEAYLTYPLTIGTAIGSPFPSVTVTDEYEMKKVCQNIFPVV
jgi:hypothetical protein